MNFSVISYNFFINNFKHKQLETLSQKVKQLLNDFFGPFEMKNKTIFA